MYRKDVATGAGESNGTEDLARIDAVFTLMQALVEKKHDLDANDRFGVVTFSSNVESMTEMVYDFSGVQQFLFDNFDFGRGTALGEGLARAVRVIINELRKIGEKQQRIILFTDGMAQDTTVNPVKIAKIAQGLGIIIDAIRVGPAKNPGNIIKRITEITGGEYFYASDLPTLRTNTLKIAKKKEVGVKTLFDKGNTITKNIFENEIAGSLLKIEDLSQEQREEHLFKPEKAGKLQCSICYSGICPTCKVSFYGCGRFCPNCLKPIHLHCGIKWAENQMKGQPKASEDKIFRCPHCFYLLKIPITQMDVTCAMEAGEDDEDNAVRVTKKLFQEASPEILDEVCGVCSTLFEAATDPEIYQCSACKSFFHINCLNDAILDEKRCPTCKRPINL